MLTFKQISEEDYRSKKYKRIIYGGCVPPTKLPNFDIIAMQEKTLRELIEEQNIFPCIVSYEETNGSKKFLEVKKTN